MSPDDFEKIIECLTIEEAAKLEMDLLTGCAICSRVLLEDDHPVEGSTIVQRVGHNIRRAVCGECKTKHWLLKPLLTDPRKSG